ncbi:hypothetical protein K0504_10070 [Neiella marina]|uniref:Actin-like protein N-terminal domain-containing protein n=1 Tax=Neiella holothuriorum TaxID=2870530 RepID=A0ABS7EGQ2_9GAMM|nr:hypothetical protein [Neiella holothuriorum]MBW8191384.1 hypothetical protein [Neiella holothuriorum]
MTMGTPLDAVIRTVDVGFGTTTAVCGYDEHNQPIVRTFASIANPIEANKRDVTAGSMSITRNVVVNVNGGTYEVGEDVSKTFDPRTARVLNSGYINSDQYKALFLGALAMLDAPNGVIDLLVGGLPVSNMHRRAELEEMMKGTHQVGDRKIVVKNAWAVAQPLGGLIHYANDNGQDTFHALQSQTVLTVDPGYLTCDWMVTSGMVASDRRSGACDLGMSKILESCCDYAAPIFKVDKIYPDTIDGAFCSSNRHLKMKGRHYPFPVCEGKDVEGNDVSVRYDFRDQIARVCREAATMITNAVGDGQDIDLIIVTGGPAQVYLRALQDVFPDHKIEIVKNHLCAIALGMQVAGINKFKHMTANAA